MKTVTSFKDEIWRVWLAGFCSCFQGHSQFDARDVGWLLRATTQRLTDGGIRSLCVVAQTEKKGGKKEERLEPKQHASHRQACVLLADTEAPHNKLGQVWKA